MMDCLKKILVGIDFSSCSAAALKQAIRIAAAHQATVAVLHVAPMPIYPVPDGVFLPFELPPIDYLVTGALEQWSKWPPAREAGAGVSFEAIPGITRTELMERVRRDAIDLLVLGAHSDFDARKGVGSVASACVQRADAMVLIVREGMANSFKSVVACVDFSETSRIALEQAIRFAVANSAELHILHVFGDPWSKKDPPAAIKVNLPDFAIRYQSAVERRLREFCRPCIHETIALKATFHAVQFDSHGKGIVDFVSRRKCDLVVLGTRGSWNARDAFWGSTAERVVREVPCSALAVKPSNAGRN